MQHPVFSKSDRIVRRLRRIVPGLDTSNINESMSAEDAVAEFLDNVLDELLHPKVDTTQPPISPGGDVSSPVGHSSAGGKPGGGMITTAASTHTTSSDPSTGGAPTSTFKNPVFAELPDAGAVLSKDNQRLMDQFAAALPMFSQGKSVRLFREEVLNVRNHLVPHLPEQRLALYLKRVVKDTNMLKLVENSDGWRCPTSFDDIFSALERAFPDRSEDLEAWLLHTTQGENQSYVDFVSFLSRQFASFNTPLPKGLMNFSTLIHRFKDGPLFRQEMYNVKNLGNIRPEEFGWPEFLRAATNMDTSWTISKGGGNRRQQSGSTAAKGEHAPPAAEHQRQHQRDQHRQDHQPFVDRRGPGINMLSLGGRHIPTDGSGVVVGAVAHRKPSRAEGGAPAPAVTAAASGAINMHAHSGRQPPVAASGVANLSSGSAATGAVTAEPSSAGKSTYQRYGMLRTPASQKISSATTQMTLRQVAEAAIDPQFAALAPKLLQYCDGGDDQSINNVSLMEEEGDQHHGIQVSGHVISHPSAGSMVSPNLTVAQVVASTPSAITKFKGAGMPEVKGHFFRKHVDNQFSFQLDTGAGSSVMTLEKYLELKAQLEKTRGVRIQRLTTPIPVKSFQGQRTASTLLVRNVPIILGQAAYYVDFIVVEGQGCGVLLGMPFMEEYDLSVRPHSGLAYVGVPPANRLPGVQHTGSYQKLYISIPITVYEWSVHDDVNDGNAVNGNVVKSSHKKVSFQS